MKSFVFFTHFCDCSVRTELIYRKDYAKNSLNRFQIGTIVYGQFSMALAFERSSGQCTRGTGNWVSAFCEFQHHPFRHIVPFPLWTIFTDRIPLLFGNKTNNDHCPVPNLFAYRETRLAIDSHSFSLSLDPQEMS